ncbi:MAG TPA: mechanosensitive ion channel domain-containing protein [Mesorhizobium sp.]|nr:mechanosensitive ion channel domain-containing protein [Mesorhizobium sp.]
MHPNPVPPRQVQRRLAAAFLLLLAFLSAAAAQGAAPASGIVAEQRGAIERLGARIDVLERDIRDEFDNDSRLVDIRLELEGITREAIGSGVAFRPRLSEINARLTELGPAPAEGDPPEPEEIRAERQELLAEKAQINAAIGAAEELSLRVGGLLERVSSLRRELFHELLFRRYAIDMALFGEVVDAFRDEAGEVARSVSAWLSFVARFKLQSALLAALLALGAATVIRIAGRRLAGRLFAPDLTILEPTRLQRLGAAFWATALPSAALAVFLTLAWFLFDGFGVLRGDIGAMLAALFQVIGVVYFVHRLARMILSPGLPEWRLIAVDSRAARLLVALISAMAVFTGLNTFLSAVYELRGSPLSLTVGESLVSTVVTGVLVSLIALVRPFSDGNGRRHWPPVVRGLLFLLAALTILPALFGYVGFARFMSRQVVLTGAILATVYLGLMFARAIAEEGALAATRTGRWIERRFRIDGHRLDQLALVFSVLLNLAVLAVGVPLIFLQWGFQWGDLRAWAIRAAEGFQVGTFRFSPLGLLIGILLFALGFLLTRWFQRWLDNTVLARGRVDAGVRNSVRLVVGYAGLAIAGLVALSAAGINLASLALVAGALSLGIGFGLQNIVNNFVSGLILLAERPFKVGDWIVAGDVTGTVRRISVRATEIETFQRQTVILPNSELINSAVGNWTHRNRLGRLDIRLNAAYGTDMRRLHHALLEVARSHPLVLRTPEPVVAFLNFGATALEIEMRVFLADVFTQTEVQNELRFRILEAFEREGFEMLTPPRAAVEGKPVLAPVEDAPAPEPSAT